MHLQGAAMCIGTWYRVFSWVTLPNILQGMGQKLLWRVSRHTNSQPIGVALRDIIFYTCKELRFQMYNLPVVVLALLVSNTLPLNFLLELNGWQPCN